MSYNVKLDVFEGPFDLLLGLIAKQKVDIYDIPIAKITDGYLAYLKAMEDLDLDVATEFLLVAATLLDLKTSTLLPKEAPPQMDEELNHEEVRENLIARLIEYKKFKSAAAVLGTRNVAESKFYIRDAELDEDITASVPDIVVDATSETLSYLFGELTKGRPLLLDADHIAPEPLRVSDFVEKIRERLDIMGRQTFRELTRDCATKAEIIASFLAVLELYKRCVVGIGQAETFGDIVVEPALTEVLAG